MKVALLALESKGPINTPLVVLFSFIQVLIKFQIPLLIVISCFVISWVDSFE